MKRKLSEVCKFQYGFPFDSSLFSDTNGTPVIRIRDIVRGFSETKTTETCSDDYIVDNGDILIGMDGEFNLAKWKGGKAFLNQRVCKLIPFDVNKDYIFYHLPKILKNIEEKTSFATVKHLSAKQLNSIYIDIPEQTIQYKIANIFIKIDSLINKRKQQLSKLDQLVKSRFIEMFGDTKNNINNFKIYSIGDICSLKSGTSLPLNVENEGGDIPYIKVSDMSLPGNERYITISSRYVTQKTAGKGIFPIGSVIFPKRGGAIGTNKKRLTQIPICADLNIMGVIPGANITPYYLLSYFDMIDLGELDNGSSVPQLNNKDIAPLKILLPPLSLQEQFTAFVQQVEKAKSSVKQSLEKLETLKKSLMQEYFG